jgi:hypothetical protein
MAQEDRPVLLGITAIRLTTRPRSIGSVDPSESVAQMPTGNVHHPHAIGHCDDEERARRG